jgi:hypothetical protein
MLDEMQRLRTQRGLFPLLFHYHQLAENDRAVWQDRLGVCERFEGKEMSRLFGELIACGWLEQNTGETPVLDNGRVAGCYRITLAGQRAVRHAMAAPEDEIAAAA